MDKSVIHQATCPHCRRKLVNLYLREFQIIEPSKDGKTQIVRTIFARRCKSCWDKEELNGKQTR